MDKIMSEVCVFLADGFEEIEGLTVVDLLRRAGIETRTVSIMGQEEIQGAHGIIVKADSLFENTDFSEVKMLVLPGGMPGTIHLKEHKGLEELILKHNEEKKYLAAICAAPTVFGGMGILKGKKAICYPGMEEGLTGADVGYTSCRCRSVSCRSGANPQALRCRCAHSTSSAGWRRQAHGRSAKS